MIVVFHKSNKVSKVEAYGEGIQLDAIELVGLSLTKTLVTLGKTFPDQILVWCRVELESWLDLTAISKLVRHPLNLISYRQSGDAFQYSLDYLDFSTSIKVQPEVRYPTWKMSSTVGAAFGILFEKFSKHKYQIEDPDFFFSAIAKAYQPHGLLSYQEPKLMLPEAPQITEDIQNEQSVFRFARQLFSFQWSFFLLVAKVIFEGKWNLLSFLSASFHPKLTVDTEDLNALRPAIQPINPEEITLDILIPTLGREQYVYDLLRDLAVQTLLPKKVIIIEQEREDGIGSQMPFLTAEYWPFEIDHTFTIQRGPCFARNIGLEKITADWVFMADDDIRLDQTMLEDIFSQIQSLKVEAATVSCLLKGQREENQFPHQTHIFGAGCSMVRREIVAQVRFDMAYEFGYAEDSDFGAQIRNLGYDVLYIPSPTILHLKAPMGGFRSKVAYSWDREPVLPKPSPTVMLFWKRHFSPKQFQGNKLMLFVKFFAKRGVKSAFRFVKEFKIKWNISLKYTNKLDSGELKTTVPNG